MWCSRALSLPPQRIRRWIDAGLVEAHKRPLPGPGRGGQRWCVYLDSLQNHLSRWALTYRGAKHMAKLGANQLLRRKLIDEATAQRLERDAALRAECDAICHL